MYLKQTTAATLFGFSSSASASGFILNHYYIQSDTDITGMAGSGVVDGGNHTIPNAKITLTMSRNVYDANNFIITIVNSSSSTGMLYHQNISFGILETSEGLCCVNLYYPALKYHKQASADFINFTETLASITPPGGKAITAPAYYPASGTAITADIFVHCIQARISGIRRAGYIRQAAKSIFVSTRQAAS